nr:50S ribosome-binding GTPase [Blastocatellia bacterium]
MAADGRNALLTIALAGNPNAGKTTLFNSLTGLKQKVANYPGVTVERKAGAWTVAGQTATLIDLPGLYSLDATSLDEQIAREVITGKNSSDARPDVIVAVVDATNLERNLYLVTQILEFGIPVVVALTMIDVFEKQEHEIDVEMLAAMLKTPVVAVNARTGRGTDELADAVGRLVGTVPTMPFTQDEDGEENAEIFARYNFI